MIELSHIHKRFGKFIALHNINLSFASGTVTGIMGPNGSGKSTLIKSILELVKPTSGTISFDNIAINGDADYRNNIGYMPQLAKFPQDLKGNEIINMIKKLRGSIAPRESELIELFELRPELRKRIGALSGGNRQKLSLVLSCMFDPKVIFLDEPTAGLDPISSTRLKDFILTLKEENKTIVLASHILNTIEEVADNVVLLLEGHIKFDGSIRELKLKTGQPLLERAIVDVLEGAAA